MSAPDLLTTVPARLFGPGLSPAGDAASVRLHADMLSIESAERTWAVALTQLSVRRVGLDEAGIELSWQEGGHFAVHVLDAAHAQALAAGLPATLTASLRQQRRQALRRRTLGWSALALVLGAPLLALAIFFLFAESIADWVAERVPLAQEVQLGELAFAQMSGRLQLHDSGPAALAVRTLGQRLTQGSPYTYHFHVVEDDTVNAFALPGGIVVVHSGLIAASRRPEELAGVLAHEVQHVQLRHSLKSLIKQAGLSALWAFVSGDLGSTLGGQAAHRLADLKFSRDAEQQADDQGYRTLVAQGIDPSGMVDFFTHLNAANPAALPAWLSTHPDSQSRAEALRQKLRTAPPRQYQSIDIKPWPPVLY